MFCPKKILTIKLRALGDTVLLSAPLLRLHDSFPHAEIHTLVDERWASVLENHPGITRLWTLPPLPSKMRRLLEMTGLAAALRKESFDCAINFHASPSSAWLALASGAKIRSVHFHGHHSANRFSTVTIPGKGTVKPVTERDMDAVRALGVDIPPGCLPRIFLKPEEQDSAMARLKELGLPPPFLGIGLGASRPAKQWPLERFAELAVSWCQRTNGSAFAVVAKHETALFQEYLKTLSDVLSKQIPEPELRASIRSRLRCERELSIRELCALLSQCSAFVGNDSGPRHLAACSGTPTVTLFGPEDPLEWHPYPRDLHPRFFMEGLPCRQSADPGLPPWCGVETCAAQQHHCMTRIEAPEVLAECLKIARWDHK